MSLSQFLYAVVPTSAPPGTRSRIEALLLHFGVPAERADVGEGHVYRIPHAEATAAGIRDLLGRPLQARAADDVCVLSPAGWSPVRRAFPSDVTRTTTAPGAIP